MEGKKGLLKKAAAFGLGLWMMLSGAAVGFAEEAAQAGMLEGVMESLMQAQSITIDAQYAVRQNGEDMIFGDVVYQNGGERQYAIANITLFNGETQDMEWSVADGAQVIRIGDDFYSSPVGEDEENVGEEAASDAEPLQARETESDEKTTADYLNTVLGQLLGSVAQNITISDTGLVLHLSGDEVPAVLNLAVSAASGTMAEEDDVSAAVSGILYGTRGDTAEPAEDKTVMSLGTNLYIDRVDLDMAVEGESISGIQCSITLVGKDAQGGRLETELAATIRFVDVNATEPAAIDMTGVQMKPLEDAQAGFAKRIW